MRFDTFDQVAKWYNDTKPVVGSVRKREDDIRPIGKRSRVCERIMKVDENTYALLDGSWTYGAAHTQATVAMAPIVWTRTPDGDYIRLRSGVVGGSTPTSRYEFLRYNTPSNMHFNYGNGRAWFRVKTGQWTDGVTRPPYEEFPLPKGDFKYDYATKTIVHDDNTFLMFCVNNDGTFTRVGEILCVTPHINRDLKKSLKPHIASFYEFCGAIAPMMDMSWGALNEYRTQINGGTGVYGRAPIPVELAREIVSQDEHELRVALAGIVLSYCNYRHDVTNDVEVKRIKAAYNRISNKMLGLYAVETK